MAAVLSEYPDEVVEMVADPRTGIGRRSEFFPNTAMIATDCDKIANKLATDRANADFQERRRATPRYIPVVIWAPNLFIPADMRDYEKMAERAKGEKPDRYLYEKNHLCVDGVKRDGIWVPSAWWEDRGGAAKTIETSLSDINKKVFERECLAAGIDPASSVSPALIKTLKRNGEIEDTA